MGLEDLEYVFKLKFYYGEVNVNKCFVYGDREKSKIYNDYIINYRIINFRFSLKFIFENKNAKRNTFITHFISYTNERVMFDDF